jgi:hypothetical protein
MTDLAGTLVPKQKNEGGAEPSTVCTITQTHQSFFFLSPGRCLKRWREGRTVYLMAVLPRGNICPGNEFPPWINSA